MTAPNRLKDRPLEPGRGRVWLEAGVWKADYRGLTQVLYCAWDETPDVVYAWIERKATR